MTVTDTSTDTGAPLKDGRVVAIAGPVVDVEFPPDAVPAINTALEMTVTVDGEAVRCGPRWPSRSASRGSGPSASGPPTASPGARPCATWAPA